jgi:hypothetical protein
MARACETLVSLEATPHHRISRWARRAWLFGEDPRIGKCFEYRCLRLHDFSLFMYCMNGHLAFKANVRVQKKCCSRGDMAAQKVTELPSYISKRKQLAEESGGSEQL